MGDDCGEGGSGEQPFELRERLVLFSLRILRLSASLAKHDESGVIRSQLSRCGTSPGAQYREACRARSKAEFISKMNAALQELDETAYWLELTERAEMMPATRLAELRNETEELIAIFIASIRTARGE